MRVAADLRPNPDFSTAEIITQLAVGEALVSVLEAKGIPSIVQRTLIRPPAARVGTITTAERQAVMAASPVGAVYDTPEDRDSAYEVLTRKARAQAEAEEKRRAEEAAARAAPPRETASSTRPRSSSSRGDSVAEAAMKSAARSMATQLGRAIVRGILGGLSRGR